MVRSLWLLGVCGLCLPALGQAQATPRVDVVPRPAERRVDVLVDGKPFTSYIYPTTLKKPTLYPLRAASGAVVTRGWPLEPRPGERVDHPHQVGLWFDYGDVNGLDFWNNSDAIPAARAPKMGTILQRAVRRAESGQGEGVLEVAAEWVDHDGTPLMREDTRFVFRAADGLRAVDRITTLTALGAAVHHARGLHRRRGTLDDRAQARQRRRHRPLPQFRRTGGRLGVGHARALDDVVGRGAG